MKKLIGKKGGAIFNEIMAKDDKLYSKLGVSSNKEDVHKSIEKFDKGIFPGAFCKIPKS